VVALQIMMWNSIKEFVKEPVAKALFAIDINSKFETSPGIKDMDKVKKFYEQLK
jgi:phosphoribosylanthranilate isomerase